jgi:hypothetical protein
MDLNTAFTSTIESPARLLTHVMHSGRLVVSAVMIAVFCGTISLLA